ncbi:N-acetylmuramoyl-L-alanine amidase [Nocardioides sp. CER19]|uniref:N-acetylmuramoyl-L-alanine amidase family protein n=1 Tax=Nocardioides sp. CER19 TaxID=3038538 RepID=UPI002446D5A1|nr:N-acetylmuramoyl-L-alanine amidase [Nocardioides sp. CER19]MDH2413363.1 N-acetylmuramoyl-L-alanine amidase [Nocardioides sp. CER19]
MLARLLTLGVACLVVLLPAATDAVTTDAPGGSPQPAGRAASRSAARVETPVPAAARPLAGRTVVLDPGHQLGNARHPREIDRLVQAGPSRKPCNTTGTSTDSGYPEATLTWQVAMVARRDLQQAGARVVLTRSSNSASAWGPCVDARGRLGGRVHADLTVSIHGDGSYARGARGFHVIAPASVRGWTDDIAAPSRRLALSLRSALGRARFPRANYIAGGDGLDVRSDLGTLNLSDVPVAMVELGNMRNATEARGMRSKQGRARYAHALTDGITRYLAAR